MPSHAADHRHRLPVLIGLVLALAGGAGLVSAVPALAATPAAIEAATAASVPGTPCTAAARACVDLRSRRAWLISDGQILRGPVPIAAGGEGEQTPTGTVFRVYRKDLHHTTSESELPDGRPAPMPYSVFFADGGVAFHAGDPGRSSAGCVHLRLADARAFYGYLRIGDHVQVKYGRGHNGVASSG